MQTKNAFKAYLPFIYIFILSGGLIFIFQKQFIVWNVYVNVLLGGNFILFLATVCSFAFYQKALRNNNVHYFMRMFYAALFIKMFSCIIATIVYVAIAKSNVNKMAIFGCLILYCIYTFFEIKILMRLSRQQKNA
jgi:hypothetical protein